MDRANPALQECPEDPFSLDAPQAYARWRARKLADAPHSAEALLVEVRDPRQLSGAETQAILERCAQANMAVYASPLAGLEDRDLPRRLGEQLGLAAPQSNLLAEDDALSVLEANAVKAARGYIPYSNRRLLWHTDGYYNAPSERIRAFILHCVRPAQRGGANRLLDPELAYIALRDADPSYIAALSAPDAMTIPANVVDGVEIRPACSGPVFSVIGGALHMRYTSRTRSIEWRADATTRAAVQCLEALLARDAPPVLGLRMEAGMGLICNNVLHDRSAFSDAPSAGRRIYRARYRARVGEHMP